MPKSQNFQPAAGKKVIFIFLEILNLENLGERLAFSENLPKSKGCADRGGGRLVLSAR